MQDAQVTKSLMRYRVENRGKCWLKFHYLPIVNKEMDKRVYQTFHFSSAIFGHQINTVMFLFFALIWYLTR